MVESINAPTNGPADLRKVVAAVCSPILTAVLATIVICSVFVTGVRQGMDHAIAWGPESEQTGMAVAISELLYGLDSYVAHAAVLDALAQGMARGTAGVDDPKFLANIANGDVINLAIATAIAVGPQPEGFVSQRSLKTMVYDDIGIVDYDKVAFSLFGFRIQSLYYLFFAQLALSAAVFLIQFWKAPLTHILLLCNLFAFWLELHAPVFTHHMPSFWGMRHGSTLAILPMWHIVLLMFYRTRFSLSGAIFAAIQVAILVLAIRVRGSAAWTVILVAVMVAVFVAEAWRKLPLGEKSATRIAKTAMKWPVILLLIGLLSSKLYTDAKLHPAYFTDDIMPYHGAWHSAYLGIIASPTLLATTGKGPENWGDRAGYDAAIAYLRKKGLIATEQDYLSSWTQTYKMRLHDNTMRAVYLSIVAEYPFTTLGMYLFLKPYALANYTMMVLYGVPAAIWLAVFLGVVALAALGVMLQRTIAVEARKIVGLCLVMAVFSALPNIWAYTSFQSTADVVLCTFVAVVFGGWAACVHLLELLRDRGVFRVGSPARR